MPTIKVYGARMGSSLRAHWMLHELGLAYETVNVNLAAGEHRQPAYLAINPAGQIPALEIDGTVVAESVAIVQFLAETFRPELAGRDAVERAHALQWALWAMFNLQPKLSTLAGKAWGRPASPEAEAAAHEGIASLLPVLETHLAARPYVAGDAFTTGDLIVAVTLGYGQMAGLDYAQYPAILRWCEACTSREAYRQATAA